MAIIIEEEKKGIGFTTILVWLIILGVIAFAAYYLFFKQPDIIDIVAPPVLDKTSELSKIKLNRATIDNDAIYNSLKSYITVPKDTPQGRLNPFLSF